MATQGPMLRAVAAALRGAKLEPQDGAAKALARRYATLIDQAAPKATYEEHLRVLARVAATSDDPDVAKAFTKVADALAAHSVTSDLGPKLLAVLASLGMTVAGRATKGGQGGGSAVSGKLGELRAVAGGRRGGGSR